MVTEFEGRMKPLACASLGPYGACLADGSEYSGAYVNEVSEEVNFLSVLSQVVRILKKDKSSLCI